MFDVLEVAMLIGACVAVMLIEYWNYFKRNKPKAKPPIVVVYQKE